MVLQADRVHRVAGIDLSDLQVGLARKRLGERIAAGTAEIVHGDAAAPPWPDALFTLVTCMSVFEAFTDPSGVLDEVFRVLRPGGRRGATSSLVSQGESRCVWEVKPTSSP